MFCHNKTLQWLQSKSEKERSVLIASARKSVEKTRAQFRERQKKIDEKRRRIVIEKLEKEEQRKRDQLARLEIYPENIIKWGSWQSEEEVGETAVP